MSHQPPRLFYRSTVNTMKVGVEFFKNKNKNKNKIFKEPL
jgi:hypothetical protein